MVFDFFLCTLDSTSVVNIRTAFMQDDHDETETREWSCDMLQLKLTLWLDAFVDSGSDQVTGNDTRSIQVTFLNELVAGDTMSFNCAFWRIYLNKMVLYRFESYGLSHTKAWYKISKTERKIWIVSRNNWWYGIKESRNKNWKIRIWSGTDDKWSQRFVSKNVTIYCQNYHRIRSGLRETPNLTTELYMARSKIWRALNTIEPCNRSF